MKTIKRARISDCGRYRYSLERIWNADAKLLIFCMLNPSTADAELDDPTIRRCMGFAGREACGGIRVVNLFTLRTSSPADLWKADDRIGGPEAERALVAAADDAARDDLPIVCAWGAGSRGKGVFTIEMMRARGARLVCLGRTKDGSPRHPLYVRADQRFEPFP